MAGGEAAAYDAYADGLHTYALWYLREHDAAADAVYCAFAAADRNHTTLQQPEQIQPWLYALLRRECRLRAGEEPAAPMPVSGGCGPSRTAPASQVGGLRLAHATRGQPAPRRVPVAGLGRGRGSGPGAPRGPRADHPARARQPGARARPRPARGLRWARADAPSVCWPTRGANSNARSPRPPSPRRGGTTAPSSPSSPSAGVASSTPPCAPR